MQLIDCQTYKIHVGHGGSPLEDFLKSRDYTSIFILVDENTRAHCLSIIESNLSVKPKIIQIASGEIHKTIESCKLIWEALIDNKADRKSLLINLGGGVIGDMGGFCASTYMRGIDFVQVPTTLLSMVDASIGAKLGIDHQGYKNIVGLFNQPQAIFIDPRFLGSLPDRELRSGYAEIIKHALISDKQMWEELISINPTEHKNWTDLICRNINIKKTIVEQDPFEKGDRKKLNFGHTIGHAVERFYLETNRPLLHGEAIAVGMICESYLSCLKTWIDKETLTHINTFLHKTYEQLPSSLLDHSAIIASLAVDKKSENGVPLFSTISSIGECMVNVKFEEHQIRKALEYYVSE